MSEHINNSVGGRHIQNGKYCWWKKTFLELKKFKSLVLFLVLILHYFFQNSVVQTEFPAIQRKHNHDMYLGQREEEAWRKEGGRKTNKTQVQTITKAGQLTGKQVTRNQLPKYNGKQKSQVTV